MVTLKMLCSFTGNKSSRITQDETVVDPIHVGDDTWRRRKRAIRRIGDQVRALKTLR